MRYKKIKYRGLVKWYDRGLQNLWREFDSLIPCSREGWNACKNRCSGLFRFAGKGTAKEQRIFGEILVGFSNVVCIEWIYIYGHVII